MPSFGKYSKANLATAHSDLQKLFNEVIKQADCTIECGYRNKEDQEKAFNKGNSKAHWGSSFHNYQPALAVDCTPYPSRWSDEKKLKDLGALVKIIAIDIGIKIKYGGDWQNFKDLPHYELTEALDIIKKGESKLGES